jgi:hypothetical protein
MEWVTALLAPKTCKGWAFQTILLPAEAAAERFYPQS